MIAEIIDFAAEAPAARRRRHIRALTTAPAVVAIVCCFMPLTVAYAIGLSIIDAMTGARR